MPLSPNDALFEAVVAEFKNRKFAAGLLLAFVDLYAALDVPESSFASFEDLLAKFPRQTQTSAGKQVNTLKVFRPDGTTLSLRPFYNKAETYFRNEMKRFDYPSCAPHATQAWGITSSG